LVTKGHGNVIHISNGGGGLKLHGNLPQVGTTGSAGLLLLFVVENTDDHAINIERQCISHPKKVVIMLLDFCQKLLLVSGEIDSSRHILRDSAKLIDLVESLCIGFLTDCIDWIEAQKLCILPCFRVCSHAI